MYDDSPTLVTIWLTLMPKISIFILLLELQIGIYINLNLLNSPLPLPTSGSGADVDGVSFLSNLLGSISLSNSSLQFLPLTNLLLLSSLLSLIIGSIVGLAQIKIKRLLAYSTISHVGFLLLSLSVLSNSSIEAFIFYIIQYTITNLNIFLIVLAYSYIYRTRVTRVTRNTRVAEQSGSFDTTPTPAPSEGEFKINIHDMENISSFKGLFYKNPLLSISFSISLFSLAGVPPLIGFFAKQQVIYSSNSAGYFFLSLVAILVSVISASYYLKIIKIIHSKSKVDINNKNKNSLTTANFYKPAASAYSAASAGNGALAVTLAGELSEPEYNNNKITNEFLNDYYQTKITEGLIKSIQTFRKVVDRPGIRGVRRPKIFYSIKARINLKYYRYLYQADKFTSLKQHLPLYIDKKFSYKKILQARTLPHGPATINFNYNYLTTIHVYIISLLTLVILFFIFNPELLLNSIAIVSSLILNL